MKVSSWQEIANVLYENPIMSEFFEVMITMNDDSRQKCFEEIKRILNERNL